MKRVLYISYDGVTQPLGQSQVVYYLRGLTEKGHKIHLVSFEKPEYLEDRRLLRRVAKDLERRRIAWHPLRYHKRPLLPATIWDLSRGIVST
ncbi:glycosyltransferase, partial [Thermodesulfobacteriota bacterium]